MVDMCQDFHSFYSEHEDMHGNMIGMTYHKPVRRSKIVTDQREFAELVNSATLEYLWEPRD